MRAAHLPVVVATAATVLLTACSRGGSVTVTGAGILGFVGFETRVEKPAGVDQTVDLAIVDLDLDGRVDLAALGADARLVVSIGQPGGEHAVGRTYPVSAQPLMVLADDLDGDGDPDLVVLGGPGTVDVFLNDGTAELTHLGPIGAGPGVLDGVLGDLDGDGRIDLTVAQVGRSDVMWLAGVGDGSFVSPIPVPFDRGNEFLGLSFADFDGDGVADLAGCDTSNNRVVVLFGVPNALPTQVANVRTSASTPVAASAGDLTGDGVADIAASNLGGPSIDVVANVGGRSFVVYQTIPLSGLPVRSTIADATGDGVNDLVACLVDRHAVALFAGGALDPDPTYMSVTGSPARPIVADVDGDQVADIAVVASRISVLNLHRGGASGPIGGRLHAVPAVPSPELVASADFDGDGRADLAVAGLETRVVTFERSVGAADARPELEPIATVDLGRPVQNVVARDVDRDGRTDLIVSVVGGIKILANKSAGGALLFDVVPPGQNDLLAPGSGPFETTVDDLDGDGALDLVVAYIQAGTVSLSRGLPNESFAFAAPQRTGLGGSPVGIVTGDFDGDGDPEVAVSRISVATVTILELGPDGLVPTSNLPVGASPNYLRSADFNGDRRDDLVVSNAASNSITLLFAEDDGFRRVDVPAGQLPTALLTEDINRDGFADVLVASLVGTDFRIFLGDGQGGLVQSLVFPGTYSALSAAFADLNGNGLEDLVIGSLESNGVGVFRNVSREQ